MEGPNFYLCEKDVAEFIASALFGTPQTAYWLKEKCLAANYK